MKKTILMTAAALGALAACTKPEADAPEMETDRQEQVRHELTVSLAGTRTRALTADSEAKVNDLQVFVFRGDALDAYGDVKSASKLSLSCTAGSREVYALVNAPDCSAVTSKAALLAKVSQLSSNSLTSFEMVGHKSVSLPGTRTVAVDVNRIASRVVVKKITRAFTAPALQKAEFTISKIYLLNVAKDINYGLTGNPSGWYNEATNKGDVAALLVDAPAAAVADKASHDTPHYFYGYPNRADKKTTRLVIETTLGGQTYYYPVNLPKMESNKSYEIAEVKITRPGSDNPDVPVSSADIQFSINVVDWTVVPVTEGTTI